MCPLGLITGRNSLKCIPSNVSFFGTDRRLAVYSLQGPHTSWADSLSYVVGGTLQGLILLCRTEVGMLKLLQGKGNDTCRICTMCWKLVLQKLFHLILTVTP